MISGTTWKHINDNIMFNQFTVNANGDTCFSDGSRIRMNYQGCFIYFYANGSYTGVDRMLLSPCVEAKIRKNAESVM